jgi:hypothetical protein
MESSLSYGHEHTVPNSCLAESLLGAVQPVPCLKSRAPCKNPLRPCSLVRTQDSAKEGWLVEKWGLWYTVTAVES